MHADHRPARFLRTPEIQLLMDYELLEPLLPVVSPLPFAMEPDCPPIFLFFPPAVVDLSVFISSSLFFSAEDFFLLFAIQ